uniref:Polistes mastoparan-R1 n=2 Tax=Polistes rothneyi TaxID=30208 RepID=MAST1_POLRT|nr:RecName: Full=Polistes mastoparan-R1; Short=Pm-R1 [Polistes rothneyi]P0DX37.1 RecName: Full=Polistes-mastoparan-R3; Short=Pm-R3 [Polistes rothneyi]
INWLKLGKKILGAI